MTSLVVQARLLQPNSLRLNLSQLTHSLISLEEALWLHPPQHMLQLSQTPILSQISSVVVHL